MTRPSNPLNIPEYDQAYRPGRPGAKLLGGVCQDCQQRITFVQMTATGRRVPVDPMPVDDGNVCARRAGTHLVGYVISKERPAESGYTRFAAHFGTCVDRPRPGQTSRKSTEKKRPAEPPPALFEIPEGNA